MSKGTLISTILVVLLLTAGVALAEWIKRVPKPGTSPQSSGKSADDQLSASSEATERAAQSLDSGSSISINQNTASRGKDAISFRDSTLGYSFKYPNGWSVNQIARTSAETNVRYLILTPSNSSTVLVLGVKRNSDPFTITNQSLPPQSEFVPVPEKAVTVAGTNVIPQAHRKNGVLADYWYIAPDVAGKYELVMRIVSPDSSNQAILDSANSILESINFS